MTARDRSSSSRFSRTCRAARLPVVLALLAAPAWAGGPLSVTTNVDDTTLDGECSLREAIAAVNAASPTSDCPYSGFPVISLGSAPMQDFYLDPAVLGIPNSNEDANVDGDLDILVPMTITGLGADQTVIRTGDTPANGFNRVFHVLPGAELTLRDVSIENGHEGSNFGGGILNLGMLNLDTVTVRNNGAANGGGGIRNERPMSPVRPADGTLNIQRSEIAGNSSLANGGGIENVDGIVNILNSTISQNTATANGAGIHAASVGRSAIVNLSMSTVMFNNAGSGGGGLDFAGGANAARASIFLANSPAACSGPLISGNLNMTDDASCGPLGSVDAGEPSGVDGGLMPVGPGTTRLHPLLPGSNAVDADPFCDAFSSGTNPLFGIGTVFEDQRGVSRPEGNNCDIGAFEAPAEPGCGGGSFLMIPRMRWEEIALSCDPSGADVQTVFDEYTPGDYGTTWVLWEHVPGGSTVPLTLTTPLDPTKAYWFKTTDPVTVVGFEGFFNLPPPIPLTAPGPATANLIPNPSDSILFWGDVNVNYTGANCPPCGILDAETDNVLDATLYKWNGATFDTFHPGVPGQEGYLLREEGGWIKVNSDQGGTVQLDLGLGRTGGTPARDAGPDDWTVRLEYRIGDLRDVTQQLGQLEGSADGWDVRDLEELDPFDEPNLQLVFPHPDWGPHAGAYATDFRAADASANHAWTFEARSSLSEGTGRVVWHADATVRARSRLVDLRTGAEVDLAAGSFSFPLDAAPRSFLWTTRSVDGTIFADGFESGDHSAWAP